MKILLSIACPLLAIVTISCADTDETMEQLRARSEQSLRALTQKLDDSELNTNVDGCLNLYDDNAISMPEYQATLTGRNEIEKYYREINRKLRVKSVHRQPLEFIHLKNSIVVIGALKRVYVDQANDSLIQLNGKYWHIWSVQEGVYRIKGEAFGYFHPVAHQEPIVMSTRQQQPDEEDIRIKVPLELKAYNALMEKGVRQRNGELRAGFFAENAVFYPFADTAVVGMRHIKPYLIAYSNRGTVRIDSVSCYTYAFEDYDDYILEYDMFKVKWSVADLKGRTQGKGIRIWIRQKDKSLRIFREIGTHNYL